MTDSQAGRAHRNLALLVAACFFMEMLDGTIVTTSAPRISRSLHVAPVSIGVVITAYLVTLAALIPLGSWLSSRLGARRVFLVAIAVFTLSSLGCALSQSLAELVVMRVVQGTGAAMMVPVGRALVLSHTDKADLMRTTAYLVWPGLLAPVIAPVAGGLITTYASWHWLFLINLPLGVLAFGVAERILPWSRGTRQARLDTLGVVLVSAGLALATMTTALLSRRSPVSALDLVLLVSSVLMISAAARHLLRTEQPLLDLRTLRIPTLRTAVTGGFVYFSVMAAAPFLAPLKFEDVFRWTAVKSGAFVLLIFAGNVAIKPATTFVYNRWGFKTVLVTSTATMALTMASLGFTTSGTPPVLIALLLFLCGVVRSVGATGYSTMAFVDVRVDQMRHASALVSTAQQLAAGFGVAGAELALRIGRPLGHGLGGPWRGGSAYTVAFLLMGLIALLATLDAAQLNRAAGAALRNPGRAEPRSTL